MDKKILLLDGAMGTTIDKELKKSIKCKEKINIENPEVIKKIHRNFLKSGCDFLKGNTFNCSKEALKGYGEDEEKSYEYAYEGAKLVKEIAKENDKKSIGVFCLPGREQISGIICGDIDYIMIETIFDLNLGLKSLEILRDELRKKNKNIPIMISFTLMKDGKLFSGENILEVVEKFINDDIFSVGINCSCEMDEIENILYSLREKIDRHIKISFHPNLNSGEETYLNIIKKLKDKKLIDIVGGCCGTTSEHIKKIKDIIK